MTDCTLCYVTESRIEEGRRVTTQPYRCSRCGACYACSHKRISYKTWLCADGVRRPVIFDPAIRTEESIDANRRTE